MNPDIIITGGGIVGLSTAYRILIHKPGLRVVLLEKERQIATHQTGNNSGVIHSGIYYRPGSLKAENCRSGYKMLLEFASENDIPYEICGKVIVAVSEEEKDRMTDLFERGKENGLKGLRKLNSEEVKELEPHVNAVAGIHVPETGIIDYSLVCQSLEKKITELGGEIRLSEEVLDMSPEQKQAIIITTKGTYAAGLVINTAGLHSDRIASLNIPKLPYRIIPFRGEYYRLKESSRHLVKNLVYPVPDPRFPFLGVHFTRMMKGETEAGPNAVFSFKREGYSRNSFSLKDSMESFAWPGFRKLMFQHFRMGLGEFYRSWNKAAFTRALQKMIPEIKANDLKPGGAGVRAQACDRNGKLIDDFVILEDKCIMNVVNAPSPAATASLAIGDTIAMKAIKKIS